MADSKHTPGEWRAKARPLYNTGNIEIHSGDNLIAVAACKEWGYGSTCTREEAAVNAALIAASPKLLAALETIERAFSSVSNTQEGTRAIETLFSSYDHPIQEAIEWRQAARTALAEVVPSASRRAMHQGDSYARALDDSTARAQHQSQDSDKHRGR